MATRGVLDRQRIAKAIVAAARMHAEEVGAGMEEVLAPFVAEGETTPDFVSLQRQLARYLEAQIAVIVNKEDLHLTELDDDLAPRRRRDQAALTLHTTLVAVRGTLSGAFGAEAGDKLLGFQGKTAVDPLEVSRQGGLALKRLTAESVEVPSPLVQGVDLDFGALAAQLQAAYDELVEALREVDEQVRLGESTIVQKDRALDVFDTAVGSVGRIVIGLDDLSGFPELGSRIRLTLPVRRRRGSSAGGASSGGPSPDEGSPLPEEGSEESPPAPPSEVPESPET